MSAPCLSAKALAMKQHRNYWKAIHQTISTLWQGLWLTWKHLLGSVKTQEASAITQGNYFSQPKGAVTLQYPQEQLTVPDRGRYKLHNEIDDCIVCDKCAQVCPVDCIEIEAIRSPTAIGTTSNGMTKRLYAARFDIDMAKCCFCGLCTTVCPTECLTTTPEYDFSVFDLAIHKVSFATMRPEAIAEKKQIWAEHVASKQTDSTSTV